MITNEAFRKSLLSCTNGKVPRNIIIALSGGVDSICLTYLLVQFKKHFDEQLQIHAVTIDHKYRNGSGEEAAKVGDIVKKWGVNHIVKSLEYEQSVHDISNFEEVARMKRYSTFESVCHSLNIPGLFVAHNLNDQLETYIQRLQGNSSIFGLAGLKSNTSLPLQQSAPFSHRERISVYRPLLPFDKSDIISTCTENGVSWFEDATNSDINLTKRNYLRHLINVEIPKKLEGARHDGDWQSISKANLVKIHNEVAEFAHSIETKVDNLWKLIEDERRIEIDYRNASLSIKFYPKILEETNIIVVSKYLYQVLFPFSSIRHYHWAYAKLERQLVPRLIKAVNDGRPDSKLTYLNLTFTYEKTSDGNIRINVTRQPVLRESIAEMSFFCDVAREWTKWELFDRRFWLRFSLISNGVSNESKRIRIVPYNHKKHLSRIHESIRGCTKYSSKMNATPVVFLEDTIIAFPTYNINSESDLAFQWYPKDNVYRPNSRL
ncbi:PP-loop family-domain-containing protein [Scheffersomyces xylosifermentans]|uniref:PP-loop family-domain-containing protein n=1 Tax=Scheffersomyces xylosifermentans TaxID=1304137 RepID=UPI00315CDE64